MDVSDAQDGFDSTYRAISKSAVYRDAVREAFPSLPQWVVPYSHLDAQLLLRIRSALALRNGTHLIDLACGLGGPGLWIAGESGASITGVDYSSSAIQSARELCSLRGFQDATFLCSDIVSTDLPAAAFDGAMCVDAMVFVPPRELAIELARILKPGARFVAVTWEAFDDSIGIATLVTDYRPILEAAGLRVLEHTVIDEDRRLGAALFNAILTREEALRVEIGDSAEGLIAEARDYLVRLQRPPRVRRIFLVAQK